MLPIKRIYIAGAVLFCTAPALFMGCSSSHRQSVQVITDRAATPILAADSVTTLISDSGVVRYRISAPQWQIFDKAQPSYWEFAQGIYLEEFDEQLAVQASLRADYAKYLDQEEKWILTGRVIALNEQGEQFETEQLVWVQPEQRIFSDSAITITRQASVIQGIGFESNQTMTRYTILNPTGFFPIEDE